MPAKWEFRLATAEDAPAFAEWVAKNPYIDPRDIKSALRENNPTAVYFCATRDGIPVAFAPFFCLAMLAHLGFDPLSSNEDRKKALDVLNDGAAAFFVQMGIRSIGTLSDETYAVAQYAMKRGFEMEDRTLFVRDLNKEIAKKAVV
jgi:hypothetical protein